VEFAITTLLAVIAVVVGYLAYRYQRHQSLKRLHYSSFVAPLVLPTWYNQEETSIKVRQGGVEFILPILCVARIENTGRVPILPSDFNGPLTIRLKGPAVFRCGSLTWIRTDIFDPRRPDPLAIDHARREISMNPVLLNPRDSITLVYIADAVPEEWKLEVSGRIAGIEKIIKLPNLSKQPSMKFGLHTQAAARQQYPLVSLPSQRALTAAILVFPVIICPYSIFTNQLNVIVDERAVSNAHLVSSVIRNPGAQPIERNAKAVITLKVSESRVIMTRSLTAYDNDGDEQGHPLSAVDIVRLDGTTVSICPPTLDPGSRIAATFIASGDCHDMTVDSDDVDLVYTEVMRMETDKLVEDNLAQAEPLLLLTNQTL
jgi:hypothetical protein